MKKLSKSEWEQLSVDGIHIDSGRCALFNVCNDYSLNLATIEEYEKEDWSKYRCVVESKTRRNYVHREHAELHYALVSVEDSSYPKAGK